VKGKRWVLGMGLVLAQPALMGSGLAGCVTLNAMEMRLVALKSSAEARAWTAPPVQEERSEITYANLNKGRPALDAIRAGVMADDARALDREKPAPPVKVAAAGGVVNSELDCELGLIADLICIIAESPNCETLWPLDSSGLTPPR